MASRLHLVLLLGATLALPLAAPGARAQQAPPTARAYAPENLSSLSMTDQTRVISLEYSEQSRGRRIPADQLRFYLDQVNRSNWTFSRIKQDIATSLSGGNGGPVSPRPPGGSDSTMTCESTDGRERSCVTPWNGSSRLVRQLSDTRCVEGRNWESARGRVSVRAGCRGEFARGLQVLPPMSGGTIRCESDGNRPRTCATPWRGETRLVRQLSDTRCTEGRTWQSRSAQVEVSGGCRGEFAQDDRGGDRPPASGSIRCESTDGRQRSCRTPWRGNSRLLRQLSDTRCTEGVNWQSGRGEVSVNRGCRGEFGPR